MCKIYLSLVIVTLSAAIFASVNGCASDEPGYCKGDRCVRGNTGAMLKIGESIISKNNEYRLVMQTDGNLVVYCTRGGRPVNPWSANWSSKTAGININGGLNFQKDGNLAMYNQVPKVVWHALSERTEAGQLVMQNDGNLVLYGCFGKVFWSTHTHGKCGISKNNVFRACEHHGTRTLQCPGNSAIRVVNAYYGRQSNTLCYPNNKVTDCSAKGSQEKIEKMCNGKSSCQINPTNSVFGDPCRGTIKYVEVSYQCLPVKVFQACEHRGTRTLQCPGNSVIQVVNAFYGRKSDKICYPNNRVTNCSARGSQEKIEKLCNGKSSCQINPINSVFGDPCWGTIKYAEVSYQCLSL